MTDFLRESNGLHGENFRADAVELEVLGQAHYRLFPDEVEKLYTALATENGVDLVTDRDHAVDEIIELSVLTLVLPGVTEEAYRVAKQRTVAAEQNVRNAGYTDPDWLSQWRYPTFKHYAMSYLHEVSSSVVLLSASAHLVTNEEQLEVTLPERTEKQKRISKHLMAISGGGLLFGIASLTGAESEVNSLDYTLAAVNSFAFAFHGHRLAKDLLRKRQSTHTVTKSKQVFNDASDNGLLSTLARKSITAVPRFPEG